VPERRRRRHRTRHGRGLAVPVWITPGSVFALLLVGAVVWLGAQFLLQTSVEDSSASNRTDGSRSAGDQIEGGADGWNPLDLVLQVGLETSGDILNPGIYPIINGVINFHSGPLSVTASTGTRGDREFLEGGDAPVVEDGTVPTALSDAYLQAPGIAEDDAEENFRRAVTLAPSDAETHLALGTFLWSRGRLDEAGTSIEAAFAHDPRHVGANRALSAFYLGTGKAIEAERHLQALVNVLDTLDTHLALGDYYLTQQRIPEAVHLLEEVATMPGANGDASSRLASIAYSEARTAAAHDLIDEALASVPTHPRALLTKAGFLIIERRLEEALELVRKAALSDPASADAHYTLGWLLGRQRQHEEAIRAGQAVLRARDDSHARRV
jgi:Flp pilus assembly protein TadD